MGRQLRKGALPLVGLPVLDVVAAFERFQGSGFAAGLDLAAFSHVFALDGDAAAAKVHSRCHAAPPRPSHPNSRDRAPLPSFITAAESWTRWKCSPRRCSPAARRLPRA